MAADFGGRSPSPELERRHSDENMATASRNHTAAKVAAGESVALLGVAATALLAPDGVDGGCIWGAPVEGAGLGGVTGGCCGRRRAACGRGRSGEGGGGGSEGRFKRKGKSARAHDWWREKSA